MGERVGEMGGAGRRSGLGFRNVDWEPFDKLRASCGGGTGVKNGFVWQKKMFGPRKARKGTKDDRGGACLWLGAAKKCGGW